MCAREKGHFARLYFNIGRINPDYVIGAAEKGAKVKIIAANMEKIPYDLCAS